MRFPPARTAPALLALLGLAALAGAGLPAKDAATDEKAQAGPSKPEAAEPHRSPIALALSADGSRLLSANQTAGTVSLVDTASGEVLDEVPTGEKPAGVALSADGSRGVVAHWYGYDAAILDVSADGLEVVGRVGVGPEPRGVAISEDGKTAYVAVGVSNEVVRVDLEGQEVTGRVGVGREPRGIALSPDGARLLVGNARSSSLSVVSTEPFELERTMETQGTNLRQVAFGPEGTYGYVANMRNRGMATTERFIDLGWVLGQRVARVAVDGSEEFSTLSLDPQGEAAADAHGVAISPDGKYLAVSCGGTHEVMIFTTEPRLPWRFGGSRDLIHYSLLKDDGRFRRVPTGGRPTEIAFGPDGKTLYVANYLEDAIQVLDADAAEVVRSIDLGGPEEISLVRRGEAIFHDAERSFNQWYSCNTCHSDGHTNGELFDTMNDGWHDFSTTPKYSKKAVPTLRGVVDTAPWTWHGWQDSLDQAMIESFTKSMQGEEPSAEDVEAIVAFLGTLEHPRNPYRNADGSLTEAAERGLEVFNSPKAACNTCHGGPEHTDGRVHVVGLEDPRRDVYEGYNPPSLKGVYDRDPYLHDGRAKTLYDALSGEHSADMVTGLGELTEQEVRDLVEYVKSL